MTSKTLVPKSRCEESSVSECDMKPVPGRKRKLDHLTWEEKVQRKKLKNRVAAQTSRDRKKKQMEEMQDTIDYQARQISALEKKCDQYETERNKILAKFEKLEKEHQKLKARLQPSRPITNHNIPEEHKYTRSFTEEAQVEGCVGSVSIKTEGSAESKLPLLKVMETESTKRFAKTKHEKSDVKALLKVILLCLLYKSSSRTSTSSASMNSTLRNLQTACSKLSKPKWRAMLHRASLQMPRVKAANSSCLNHWWGAQTREWSPPKIAVA